MSLSTTVVYHLRFVTLPSGCQSLSPSLSLQPRVPPVRGTPPCAGTRMPWNRHPPEVAAHVQAFVVAVEHVNAAAVLSRLAIEIAQQVDDTYVGPRQA